MKPSRTPLRLPSPPPGESAPGRICVVHLVRAANGLAPFERFLAALREHPPGVEHELVLALKGFDAEHEADPYLRLAGDFEAHAVHFPDRGLDLGVYFAAAALLRRERYCFLNSFSEPLIDGWLGHLQAALELDDVGMVGATGSWNSPRSWVLNALGIRTPYRGLLPSRRAMREQFARMEAERALEADGQAQAPPADTPDIEAGPRYMLRAATRFLSELPAQTRDYELFPAHHLRSNAFAIEYSTLAELRLHEIEEKSDAYVLESGRESLTRQVQRLGMRTVVADCAGRLYDQERWPESLTLWQRSQEGLLVADNQTRAYQRGDLERRRFMSVLAWASRAEPTAPRDDPPR